MGVHGLTTFLREKRSTLSKTIHFSGQDAQVTPVVVDGWSFIYKVLQDSNLPWVYGGEYYALTELVVNIVKAWLAVGLRPIFVFDGSTPPEKFATTVSRLNQSHVQQALLFFRTSAASRNTRRFLNDARIIPPMAYTACVYALLSFRSNSNGNDSESHDADEKGGKIEVHFADEEGDPYAVELAGRVGGYVTGRDSDFVVLNSESYLGYIPLDEMVWLASSNVTSQPAVEKADDGFQSVKSKKRTVSERATVLGIIPPESGDFSLSASLYTPASLAHHLNIPVSLLPLLGALVGNDYTLQAANSSSSTSNPKAFQNLLFERRLNLSQRIMHASATLSMLLHQHSSKRKQKAPQSVMELIQMTVGALLLSSGAPTALVGTGQQAAIVGTGQQAAIVENIVEGTLPYAIALRPAEDAFLCETVCALHLPHECRLVAQMDRAETEDSSNYAEAVSALYLRAYRLGKFSPSLMDILSTRTFWPEMFLEDPDVETVARSVSRHVREFAYALLEEGIALPASQTDNENEEDAQAEAERDLEEDLDELIDVVEESEEEYDYEDDVSANVGKLRGALRDLQFEEGEQSEAAGSIDNESFVAEGNSVKSSTAPSSSIRSPVPLRRPSYVKKSISARHKVVTEYVRRGTRVVAEEIEVRALRHFVFSSTSVENESTTIPIQLRSETERVHVLFNYLQVDAQDVSTLSKEDRMPVLSLRVVIRRMHERAEVAANSKERHLERWTRKEARAFLASMASSVLQPSVDPPTEISERAIQLTAQISTALECIEHIVQVLLLTDAIPGCAHRFSGLRFHSLLASSGDVDVAEGVWSASANGMETCFVEERKGKKAKRKAQKAAPNTGAASPANGRGKIVGAVSMYSLLADISM